MQDINEFLSKKQVSAGVLIICPSGLLICHPTGKPRHKTFWDLPKGHIEPGEQPIDTAIRETREETGIELDRSKLQDLGEFYYIKKKNVHLFKCVLDQDIDLSQCYCTVSFVNDLGYNTLEMDDYMYTRDPSYLYPAYKKIFEKLALKL